MKEVVRYSYKGVKQHIRKKVLERDGYRCVICGISEKDYKELDIFGNGRGLDCAHIKQRRIVMRDDVDNLITLCYYCHLFFDGVFPIDFVTRKSMEISKLDESYYNGRLEELKPIFEKFKELKRRK